MSDEQHFLCPSFSLTFHWVEVRAMCLEPVSIASGFFVVHIPVAIK